MSTGWNCVLGTVSSMDATLRITALSVLAPCQSACAEACELLDATCCEIMSSSSSAPSTHFDASMRAACHSAAVADRRLFVPLRLVAVLCSAPLAQWCTSTPIY